MDLLSLQVAEASLPIVIFNLLFSFVLQLAIVWVYRKTHKGLSYSPSFLFTLVIIGVVGTMIMMVVQQNIVGAFALLGAFSLIRFRTIVKETRDIAFVFLSLTVGVSVGTGSYDVALVGCLLIIGIIFFLHTREFGDRAESFGFILTFNSTSNITKETLDKIFSGSVSDYELLQAKNFNDMFHFVYSVALDDSNRSSELIGLLKDNSAIIDPELITGKHGVEY
ncbi:MAG: putative membrane protein YhiD involved in acid resistance [Candidatus Paceibacteria bacterium]|jgi:uncharacterized membrane protein YhiD involved in acid resistance